MQVYNGLMARPDWKTAVKIPVGVIPGGSGNGLARALSHAAGYFILLLLFNFLIIFILFKIIVD